MVLTPSKPIMSAVNYNPLVYVWWHQSHQTLSYVMSSACPGRCVNVFARVVSAPLKHNVLNGSVSLATPLFLSNQEQRKWHIVPEPGPKMKSWFARSRRHRLEPINVTRSLYTQRPVYLTSHILYQGLEQWEEKDHSNPSIIQIITLF